VTGRLESGNKGMDIGGRLLGRRAVVVDYEDMHFNGYSGGEVDVS